MSLVRILMTTLLLAVAGSSFANQNALVNAEWVADNIDDVIVLDARKDLASFTKIGHIERARLVNVSAIRVDQEIDSKKITRMRPNKAQFEQFVQLLGINNDDAIVITYIGDTPGQLAGAARLYWHFKTYNFKHVSILNGGNKAWEAALEDLVIDDTPAWEKGQYKVKNQSKHFIADMQEVSNAVNSDKQTLIDTRELRYHIGIDKKDYVYDFGHIPSSLNIPYKLLSPLKGTATFNSKEVLNATLSALKIPLDNDIILYCNSAYECSSVWFVLHEILGHEHTKIYDGSLHQWTQYKNNPMTTVVSR